MQKNKHSALSIALSFHYQVLVGLEYCFSLKENQSILFELDGDVSLRSSNPRESLQTEVKSYTAPLTDNHLNLWKTLRNWLNSDFDHEKYGLLVLHTTQAFGTNTRLKDWNSMSGKSRLNVLKEIFDDRSNAELEQEKLSKVISLQKEVMSIDDLHLEAVLDKVRLFTEAMNEEKIKEQICSRLIGIPGTNINKYLEGLIGFIYGNGNRRNWSISYKSFKDKCEELTAHFSRREFTFPPFSGTEASQQELESHNDRPFVQKIKDIEHYEQIPEAVGNWLELQNSMLEELHESVLYRERTKNYQDQLVRRYKRTYSSAKLEAIEPIKSSQILFNKVINETPPQMNGVVPPMEYKNGLLHDAMDDDQRSLKWNVQ